MTRWKKLARINNVNHATSFMHMSCMYLCILLLFRYDNNNYITHMYMCHACMYILCFAVSSLRISIGSPGLPPRRMTAWLWRAKCDAGLGCIALA